MRILIDKAADAAHNSRTSFIPGVSAAQCAATDVAAPTRPWPFTGDDAPPLAWWRTLPADRFRDAEHLLVRSTLDGLTVMTGDRRWREALRGDAAAAAGIAIVLMPAEAITLRIDIAMTAVLCAALDDDPVASLLLVHFLSHAHLDHPFGAEIAQSWRDHDRRFADRFYSREAAKAAASASVVVGARSNPAAGHLRADEQAKRSPAANLSAADLQPDALPAGGLHLGYLS